MLRTASVLQQVGVIVDVAEELKSYLGRLQANQQRKAVPKFVHALKSGDEDDKELEGVLNRLDRARDELNLRISVTQVGLVGNLKEGFRVAFDILMETNNKVKEILGRNLALADQLKGRSLQQIGIWFSGLTAPVDYANGIHQMEQYLLMKLISNCLD